MKFFTAVILCLAFGCCLGFEDKTIVEWLSSNGNYNTLVTAVSTAGLAGALSGPGPFTVFAPTDTAFNKLGGATINNLLQSPNQLADILKYHVVGEFVVLPMINTETNKTTLQGGQLNLLPSSGGLLINGNSAQVSSSSNDIIVNNGVIQPIDNVLLPPKGDQPSLNIAQFLISEDNRFKDLNMAVYFSELTATLESGDYTMFAPVDEAWRIPNNRTPSDPTSPETKPIYQEILKYHIVPGARSASQLTDGQKLFTLHGTTLAVTVSSAGVKINNSTVIDADLKCTNGIVHAVDRLLFPDDLRGPSNRTLKSH